MKKAAARVLKLGLLDALIGSERCIEVLQHIEHKTDLMATLCEELEDRAKEMEDGKSDSVY